MYYEFYIDVFFVVNLVMDFFILQLVNRMILGAANPLRSLAGAVLGAVGSGVILFTVFFMENKGSDFLWDFSTAYGYGWMWNKK